MGLKEWNLICMVVECRFTSHMLFILSFLAGGCLRSLFCNIFGLMKTLRAHLSSSSCNKLKTFNKNQLF